MINYENFGSRVKWDTFMLDGVPYEMSDTLPGPIFVFYNRILFLRDRVPKLYRDRRDPFLRTRTFYVSNNHFGRDVANIRNSVFRSEERVSFTTTSARSVFPNRQGPVVYGGRIKGDGFRTCPAPATRRR